MSEKEFWRSTAKYFAMRYRAWEQNQHAGWEQARMISFWVVKTVDAKKRFKKFEDLMRLPWETKTPKLKPVDPEAMQKFSDEADEVLKVLNPEAWEAYQKGKAAKENPA